MSAVIFRIMGLWEKKILKAEVWKKKKSQLLNLKCYLYMKMCSSKSDYIF